MTGNNMLSQEEIDALLSSNDENSDEDIANFDALGEIGNIAMGAAATALSTLLQQKVSITVPEVDYTDPQTLREMYPLPFIAIEVEYTKGLKGQNLLVFHEDDAKIIANLMMGGDGKDLEDGLSEITFSAIGEAMNQMMGSASTSMSTVFGESVQISPPSVQHLDLNQEQFDFFRSTENMVRISFQMKIGELVDSMLMLLLSPSFAQEMVDKLMQGMEGGNVAKSQKKPNKAQKSKKSEVARQVNNQRQRTPTKAPAHRAINGYNSQQSYKQTATTANTTKTVKQQEPVHVQPAQFAPLESQDVNRTSNIDLILDVPLELTVELGRTRKSVGEILDMGPGTIIELDKLAGEPVDLYVNGKRVAKGEVVVIEENFAVRITDIISVMERVTKLQ